MESFLEASQLSSSVSMIFRLDSCRTSFMRKAAFDAPLLRLDAESVSSKLDVDEEGDSISIRELCKDCVDDC